ncbi:MAG: aldehyde dehydrogenase family protein, partial [Candidatus Brocadiia bacterium]|nr:aldehyde dehydrogenase family protein [Candidatus Brocadiia bacterium]
PVLSLWKAKDLEQAIGLVNTSRYGNSAILYTESGKNARKFHYDVDCGNIGVNIGVAAPIACFPFCGLKDSFFGDIHGQSKDAINFFTHKKVLITRWY